MGAAKKCCPKCGSDNISYQREQTGSVGVGTNTVYVQPAKRGHGCFYWCFIGWWLKPIYWISIGWWWNLFFGRRKRGGLGFRANKSLNRTVGICQNCGHTWKA